MRNNCIRIKGARQNNLKNLNLDIPLNRLTVVTGVSGSGKSSLAFDTLYAEGQRRYVETFSPYARQFMDRMDRPRVDSIEGIPPAIAIDRKDPVRTSRSTVGTMTELTDYIKLLFVRLARLHCQNCGDPVIPETPDIVWKKLQKFPENSKLVITFPYDIRNTPPTLIKNELFKTGFDRAYVKGQIEELSISLIEKLKKTIHIVFDRVVFQKKDRKRIIDSLESAFRFGGGRLDIWLVDNAHMAFSEALECPRCHIAYATPTPNLFSFNSPAGACDVCRGFGRTIDIDIDLIIPDDNLTLEEGAIKPWGTWEEKKPEYEDMVNFCRKNLIPTHVEFKQLTIAQKRSIIDGTPEYYGIRGFFRWLETKTYKMPVRVYLSRYRSYDICHECHGTRFKKDTLLYRLKGQTIAEIYAQSVHWTLSFFDHVSIPKEDKAGLMVLDAVRSRLKYLKDVGLGYLTLDRQSRTLSGGEVQRVSLAAALGSSLVNTLYILDEPSIGLHPSDTHRLINILHDLRDLSNTLVVVEHDPDIISQSDYLLDLGPGAGENGGEVMYFGPTSNVDGSLTGQYLKGEKVLSIPKNRRIPQKNEWLTIKGASENNLKNIDVSIPLGLFVCLTGVSGSGKSTLAEEILYKAIKYHKRDTQGKPGTYESINGLDKISDSILVDQHPIGRTPRANVLTYTKALDPIRKLLSKTRAAKQRKFDAGYFSFNVAKGRCKTCKGDGFEKIEMQFLSDVYITCPDCTGKRFSPKVLEVYYNGKNIHNILDMTVDEALTFFHNNALIHAALLPLTWVGLGYIRLGQPINTFSGGEAQRLKLSRYLKPGQRKKLLFIFDEPTTGLHFDDIEKLLDALKKLVLDGHTLFVIEHNMDVIKTADWVIDIGPKGGDEGGYMVASGTPEEIAANPKSITGKYLSEVLSQKSRLEHAAGPTKIAESEPSFSGSIVVRGAREHNLKNISVSLPWNQLVVLTGVSGSGKSTLAFDIIFAEGQRRYLESLAPYVRQYMKILERPDVDLVFGIPPTVAIEQRISHTSRRSTVATLTETYHFLRLLFSKIGEQYCTGCGKPLSAQSPEDITASIHSRYRERTATILSTKISGRKGFHKDLLDRLAEYGFTKARIDEKWVPLKKGMSLSRYHEHTIDVVIGEIQNGISVFANTKKNHSENNLQNLIETALAEGDGSFLLMDMEKNQEVFSTKGICSDCGIGLKPLDPRLFSFNSAQGACPVCNGLGVIGAVDEEDDSIFSGNDFEGQTCPACRGSRLKPDALSVKIGGFSIWDLMKVSSVKALSMIRAFSFSPRHLPVAEPIMAELFTRLSLLNQLGLSYLALGRSANTLSGGEAQRVRLAAQLGSNLTGVCYVLDEPTIGLHPRDNHILIDALKILRDRGNTVLVVEHDEDTIRAADTIIDLGPGAGQHGGMVVASGKLSRLKNIPESITGNMFNGHDRKISSRFRPYKNIPTITVKGASSNNLKHIHVQFPLGVLICVTGVSGSGKSTLLKETLYNGLRNRLLKKSEYEGCNDGLEGWKNISRVLEVDHSPIGRTPRSIPASYIGFLSQIRLLFSQTPEARSRGYLPGRFSFNVKGGRCETCKGHGSVKTTMSFLPDVYVRCETCEGRRFNVETLNVFYKGKTIADVLDLTFEEAAEYFESIPMIRKAVKFVCDIGLGYLKLGQPSPTLSGGEAQRIKLASELGNPGKGPTFFILDEPTTGLHHFDIKKLLTVLQALVDAGNTVAVIEHNLEIIKEADYIIDLGPEGGDGGGYLVTTGSPDEVIKKAQNSYTARFLKQYVLL
jgi:excinuclease ABC subunit A